MSEESIISARIKGNYTIFSKSEKRIADYMISNPSSCINATAKDIAEKTDTSAATVVRFSRVLGFTGLEDMKRFLLMNSSPPAGPGRDTGSSSELSLKQETFQYNENCVSKVYQNLDEKMLSQAVAKLAAARMVYLIGMGGSGSSVSCAYDAFLKIGIPCTIIMDPIFQVMTLSAEKHPRKCAVLCICHSGRVRDLLDTMQIASERGMTTIGLTGFPETPMNKYLDYQILMGANEHPVFSDSMAARICELNVLSLIYAGLVRQLGNKNDGLSDAINNSIGMKRTK